MMQIYEILCILSKGNSYFIVGKTLFNFKINILSAPVLKPGKDTKNTCFQGQNYKK